MTTAREPRTQETRAEEKEESQTYPANCHCGQVTYSVTLSPPLSPGAGQTVGHEVINCNCSICTRNGYLLVYPLRSAVVFHNDSWSKVARYQFNTKTRDHVFCPRCGTSILIDFWGWPKRENFLGVNVCPFRDIEIEKLNLVFNDGRGKINPPYDDSGRWYESTDDNLKAVEMQKGEGLGNGAAA